MLFRSVADGALKDRELATIGEFVGMLPVFRDYDKSYTRQAVNDCTSLLDQDDGLDVVLALARKSGLDGHQLVDVWSESDFRSPIVEGAGRAMWDGQFDVSFHLRTMVKDTELIRNHAESLGVPVMLSNTVHELNKVAQNLGWGELNATAIFKLCELMAGITPAAAGEVKEIGRAHV